MMRQWLTFKISILHIYENSLVAIRTHQIVIMRKGLAVTTTLRDVIQGEEFTTDYRVFTGDLDKHPDIYLKKS